MLLDRIVVSRDVVHGKPRIAGTRVMVYQVLDLLAAGKTTTARSPRRTTSLTFTRGNMCAPVSPTPAT